MAAIQRQAGYSLSRLLFGTPSLTSIPQSTTPLLPALALPTLTITLPGFLSDIWEGILRAVPKKKTSHAKRRHRFYAGKALKDVQSLNSCPGCGRTKKAHHICPYCWSDMVVGFNKVKNQLLGRTRADYSTYEPKTRAKDRAMADKWIDIEAEATGRDPDELRAERAEKTKEKHALNEQAKAARKQDIRRSKEAARRAKHSTPGTQSPPSRARTTVQQTTTRASSTLSKAAKSSQ